MPFRLLDPSLAVAAPIVEFGEPLTQVGETLSTLRAELFEETGRRTNLPLDQNGRLDKAINWAYRNMMAAIKIKECYAGLSLNLVVNQPFYGLPKQLASISEVSVIDSSNANGGWKLLPMDKYQYTKAPDDDNDPTNYFRYGRVNNGMLVVYPDPIDTQAIIIEGRIRPDDLTDDTDSPLLPQEFHEPLLLLARSRAFRMVEDFQKARQAQNDYMEALGPILSTDADEDAELPSGIQFVKDPSDLVRSTPKRRLWGQTQVG